ncbi:hypothetical protein [Sulfitobacter geojensis]|uniref:Uncharacterized protein n=1 Tax=Sulfitobacter geojensis TaxID=1342299 RepID=A0AAE2W2F1_9RHOB|nr:hypothetical protein [Sulfitobacter geojensis]MBM1691602.1 hypothetical protein [Sulfitobacter geojensis]MBM1695668.1 hypothetical protein [Sulfitobacter geojensis]MBM1707833.1 hypothetical protein [Sulfitobacter geojensis]MBM1711892.1 hypothetical protein [Sulfitobacter geojensis]MBM1715957.1 hypothetical protein [Sulfitobacter geojensis]
MEHYIIVGRKIDQGGTSYLHSDGSINKSATKNGNAGEALNVEYIGKKIVELSQKDPLQKGSSEYRRETEIIRNALVIVEPDNFVSPAAELKAMLDNVTVELEYDTRVEGAGNAADTNIRKLVIPSRGSFDYRQKYFKDEAPNPGFKPPLTYTLDQQMMKLFFRKLIAEVLGDYRDENDNPLPVETREGLTKQIDKKLGNYDEIVADAEDATEKSMANVLTNPLSAFYRAVGIYTTNMCD